MRLFSFKTKSLGASEMHSGSHVLSGEEREGMSQDSSRDVDETHHKADKNPRPSVIESRLTQSINTHFYSKQTEKRKTSLPAKPSSSELCQQCNLSEQRPWTRSIQSLWPHLCSCQSKPSTSICQQSRIQSQICNIFWKSSLTFHPYTHGCRLVDFGELWPNAGWHPQP